MKYNICDSLALLETLQMKIAQTSHNIKNTPPNRKDLGEIRLNKHKTQTDGWTSAQGEREYLQSE